MRFVPVLASDRQPLMPCSPRRARRLIERREATPFWRKGIFCIVLRREPAARHLQEVAVGVDPGSKQEGFSVVGPKHTYLNVQASAITHVGDAVADRRAMRKARRFRNTPCRPNRRNRKGRRMPPSTHARWNWKRRILVVLCGLFPVAAVVVEDIEARTRPGQRRWNASFSPLKVGKRWFYEQVRGMTPMLVLIPGYVNAMRRKHWFCLAKSKEKLARVWHAHAVDAWCLAAKHTGALRPSQTDLLCWEQPRLHRRALHRKQPGLGGVRTPYGGTRSHGFKRGSLVRHPKWGLCTMGGLSKDRVSLHHAETGMRLTRHAKPADVRVLAFNHWRATHMAIRRCAQYAIPLSPESDSLSQKTL